MHGKEYFSKWIRVYEELQGIEGLEELKSLFAINYEQLTLMAHVRMGGNVSVEEFFTAGHKKDVGSADEPEDEIHEMWVTRNGIIVPNSQ